MQIRIFGAAPGSKEFLRRQKALLDFLGMGPARSIEGLWQRYIELRRQDPKGTLGLREQIPTTSKGTIYRWAKEDRWYEQAAAYDAEVAERERREIEKVRQRVLEEMALFAPSVVEELRRLITEGKPEVRLKAIETWLDRLGIVRWSVPEVTRKQLEEQKQKAAAQQQEISIIESVPPEDAPEEVWAQWLAKLHEQA
jgi:hypothetical protein